jgi:succinoglycan biosynthesis protein ExoA
MEKVSFVIPVPYSVSPERAVDHIRSLDYPQEDIEIIVAQGNRPSLQRNQAVLEACGDVIYFLDDDSFISPGSLQEGLRYLQEDDVAAVGGPALTHSEATFLEKCFGQVVGSFCGTFITRVRNKPVGAARRVRGEELILCNMMFKKESFLRMKGLDVNLYPNEENELLKRMRKSGHAFYYVPEMIVYRTRRKSILSFIKQIFQYGLGRAKHIVSHFSWNDLVFFVPSLFVLYALTLLFIHPFWYTLPLLLYGLIITASSLRISCQARSLLMFPCLLFLFPILHFSYGTGLLLGLLRLSHSHKSRSGPVHLHKIQELRPEGALKYGVG